MSVEIWRTLIYNKMVYKDLSISNYGKVKSNKTNTIYKQNIDKNGHKRLTIYLGYKNNKIKNKNITIHRAVACTFIPNPNNLPSINHKDGIKTNNYAGTPENNFTDGNLEWCTNRYNTIHARDNGLLKINEVSGANNIYAKLTEEQVRYIRNVYVKGSNVFGAGALAKKFNVTNSTISNIINHKTYKNVEM